MPRSASAMPIELALQALVRGRGDEHQRDFGRRAAELLPTGRDVRGHPCPQGLEIFAADEDLMRDSLRLLQRFYGDRLACDGIKVRLLAGDPVREPVMAVRISSRAEFREAIVDELQRRGARIDARARSAAGSALIAATAPMKRLLGLPAQLAALTKGSSVHWIRVSHYVARG